MMFRRLAPVTLLFVNAWGSVVDESYKPKEANNECTLTPGDDQECVEPDTAIDSERNETDDNNSNRLTALCLDDRDECPKYSKRGDCNTNKKFMHAHCKLSCNVCPSNLQYFDTDYGEPQEISGKDSAKIEKRIQDAEKYMKTKVAKLTMYHSVRDSCINRDKLCSKWAADGECENNPNWMLINCAVSTVKNINLDLLELLTKVLTIIHSRHVFPVKRLIIESDAHSTLTRQRHGTQETWTTCSLELRQIHTTSNTNPMSSRGRQTSSQASYQPFMIHAFHKEMLHG